MELETYRIMQDRITILSQKTIPDYSRRAATNQKISMLLASKFRWEYNQLIHEIACYITSFLPSRLLELNEHVSSMNINELSIIYFERLKKLGIYLFPETDENNILKNQSFGQKNITRNEALISIMLQLAGIDSQFGLKRAEIFANSFGFDFEFIRSVYFADDNYGYSLK